MKSLRSGDLVYLPAHFMLTKLNNDGTVSQYCELKEPCVCILLRSGDVRSDIFYRGQTWNADNIALSPYIKKGEKEHVSYTG